MPDRYATIGLSTVDATGPEPQMHVRAWRVPVCLVAEFAAAMAVQFGDPDEMFSPLSAMENGAERAAEEGGAVYMIGGEVRHG